MLLKSYTTPTYERLDIDSAYDYVAVVRDGNLLNYKKLPGQYRAGWIFTEVHVFDNVTDLQTFVESFGVPFFEHWNETNDNPVPPWEEEENN